MDDLVRAAVERGGLVAYPIARAAATRPSDFELVMQTLAGELCGDRGLTPGEAFRF